MVHIYVNYVLCGSVLREHRTGTEEITSQQPIPAVPTLWLSIENNQVIIEKYCYCWEHKKIFCISIFWR